MPGKNKQQKNAFYFYMQELYTELKREGRVFPNGLADVAQIAHPRYKALDDKERERFENMSKEFKKRMRGQPGDAIRQDNVGNIVAHRKDDVTLYEQERAKEIKVVKSRWPPQDITEEKFHFMDAQSLCKTKDGEFLPVEIALIEFSLKDGILRRYHKFLKPPPIPTGMRFECMSKSADTHQIPVEGHPECMTNFLSVQNSIENFLNPGGARAHSHPLYALREEWAKCDFTLEYIRNQSCLGPRAGVVKVYELESLFVAMVGHSGRVAPPSKEFAYQMLTGTTHDYHSGLKCEFHEELECKHCSLLWVRKFCYAMADSLKACYDYERKPHTHMPTIKGPQFIVAEEDNTGWLSGGPSSSSNSRHTTTQQAYKLPANMPRTASVLAPKMGKPAPVLRPPGAAELDYRKNQTSDIRYQPEGMWRAPTPQSYTPTSSMPSTRNPSPPASDDDDDMPIQPSKNVGLSRGREATWVPNGSSKAPWSRRTTPASTPRATPRATPMATPLATPSATPRHSPPRENYFPPSFARHGVVAPPPGFSGRGASFPDAPTANTHQPGPLPQSGFQGAAGDLQSFTSPPPGFSVPVMRGSLLESGVKSRPPPGWGNGGGDEQVNMLASGFPALSVHSPGKGRGRGSALGQL